MQNSYLAIRTLAIRTKSGAAVQDRPISIGRIAEEQDDGPDQAHPNTQRHQQGAKRSRKQADDASFWTAGFKQQYTQQE